MKTKPNSGSMRVSMVIALTLILMRNQLTAATIQDKEASEVEVKYKITILEDASKTRRGKKGRVSSETVVRVTDLNNVPVAGIAVAFTIAKVTSGSPKFANGNLTSIATTDATGTVPSGVFSTITNSTFTMSITASTPGRAITAIVPIKTSAIAVASAGGSGTSATAAASGAGATSVGLSTAAIVGIVAGAAAAAAVGIGVGLGGGSGSARGNQVTQLTPRGSISVGSGVTFGPPND